MLVMLTLLHFMIFNMGLSTSSKSAFPVNFMLMLIACGYCSAQCDPPTGLTVPAILIPNSEEDGRLFYCAHCIEP